MKLRLSYKLKSGALQFVIFVAVLIALILSGLILYAYTFVFLKEQSKVTVETIQLSDSGISYVLQNEKMLKDTLLLDFDNKENQTIKAYVSQWGLFEKVFVQTRHRQKQFEKTAVIGSLINSESPNLYLQETNTPLVLVGSSKIKGNIFLPLQGVKPGYIAGESYYGSRLIYGTVNTSGKNLPALSKQCIESLYYYTNDYDFNNVDYTILKGKKVIQSFKQTTRAIYSKQKIVLEDIEMVGNFIIKSDSAITIKKTAVIKDLILIAPFIEIEDEVEGAFQVLASSRITVGKNCRLNYPSSLVLLHENIQESQVINQINSKVFIDEGSVIRGSVCYITKGKSDDFYPQIILERTARIKGQVYCMGNFELKGRVSGSVFTKQFVANKSGSIYMNHVYDGVIEGDDMPEQYGGILFENQQKIVMKWLY